MLSLAIGVLGVATSFGQTFSSDVGLWPAPKDAKVIEPGDRCNDCTRPAETRPTTRFALPGLWGRPYVEPPVGDCQCGRCTGVTRHPGKSIYWPRPLSGHFENKTPGFNSFLENYLAPALTAPFDGLGGFKGLSYQRRDSGYAGCGRDPYGCLGESNQPGNCK